MVNLSEIFRSIFGLPKERLGPNDLPRNIQEDFENLYGRTPDLPWQQQHPPSDLKEWSVIFEHPEHGEHRDEFHISEGDFLQEFEQMFQNFFRGFPFDFNPSIQGPPTTDRPPDLPLEMPLESSPNYSESLRDRMLKRPESDNFEHRQHEGNPSERFSLFPPFSMFGDMFRVPFGGLSRPDERVDRDLDSEVERGTQSLDDILVQKDERQMPQHVPRSSSSSSSFSSVTIVDSNGVTERRTTRRDSSGKEEVMISRKIGDQTHTVTHKKDESGNEETQEDLVNIDNDGLEEFNEKWHHSKTKGKHPHLSDDRSPSRHTPLSSIYESVLEQFFPRR